MRPLVTTRSMSSESHLQILAAARHGADLVLHHLGPQTQKDVDKVKAEVEAAGRRAILVPGDISDVKTSAKVS